MAFAFFTAWHNLLNYLNALLSNVFAVRLNLDAFHPKRR